MSQDVPNEPSPADDNPFQPHRTPGANPDEWLNSAAVYVRMSTEHQQYSTSNQMDVIREYAKKRGQEIVKEYSDDGKSGLNIKGRGSLEQMIRDVLEGKAHYKSILVYDVSRWGRFQDADESAYYEYICKQAGVAVHYCAEQFENDGSPISTIIKGIKRTMAGEYSRELSTKVYQGACRLVKLGFRQGGAAGYGLRRVAATVSSRTGHGHVIRQLANVDCARTRTNYGHGRGLDAGTDRTWSRSRCGLGLTTDAAADWTWTNCRRGHGLDAGMDWPRTSSRTMARIFPAKPRRIRGQQSLEDSRGEASNL